MEFVEGKGTGRLIAGCVLEVIKTSSLQAWQSWSVCKDLLMVFSLFQLTRKNFSINIFFQAEDGIRDPLWSRGLGDVYKRQGVTGKIFAIGHDEMEFVEGKGTGRLIAGCVLEVLKTSSLQGWQS